MISSHVSTNSSISPKPAKKGPGIPWVALALLGVIGYVLYRAAAGSQGFDWVRFRTTLQSMDPWYCALAILFIILSYFGRAVRWEVMIRPLGPTPSLWRLFVGTAIGFTAVVLLGRPGEIFFSRGLRQPSPASKLCRQKPLLPRAGRSQN